MEVCVDMKSTPIRFAILILFLILMSIGCIADIARNPDGSLRIETKMTAEAIQTQINLALADPTIKDLTVVLHEGYIYAQGTKQREGQDINDTLSFNIRFGAEHGVLTAVIYDAKFNQTPIPDDQVSTWNITIAEKFQEFAMQTENASVESVHVNPEAVVLILRVETPRSQEK